MKMDLQKLNQYLEALPTPVFFKDLEGRYTFCNRAFSNLVGYAPEDVLGRRASDIGQGIHTDLYQETDRTLMSGEGVQIYEVDIPHPEGGVKDVQVMKDLVRDGKTGEPLGFAGVAMDITERNGMAKELEHLLRMKDVAVEISREVLNHENINGFLDKILSKCMEIIPKADVGAILVLDGKNNLSIPVAKGYDMKHMERSRLKLEETFAFKEAGGVPRGILLIEDIDKRMDVKFPEMLMIDGNPVKSSLVAPIWVDGALFGFLDVDSTSRRVFDGADIERLEYIKEQIQHGLSKHMLYKEKLELMRKDAVTGFFNRLYFEELAEKSIALAKDSGQKSVFILFDIDRMKRTNDTYGHQAGDLVLKTFADRLRARVRGCDILGRYGGDEFAAIFPGSSKEDLVPRIRQYRTIMESQPIPFGNESIELGFSFGMAEFDADGKNLAKLVKSADEALYADKNMRRVRD